MSSFVLKIFACIFMLIDHTGLALFPQKIIFRLIGRIAFPLFAFQIAVSYKNTSNKSNYLKRMLIFAFISQLPYSFFLQVCDISPFSANVGFTFSCALFALYLIELYKKDKNILYLIMLFPLLVSATLLQVDYSWYGILTVILFYLIDFKKYFFIAIPSFVILTCLHVIFKGSLYQLLAIFSLIFIAMYNGKKGTNLKGFFYIFYPTHLLILSILNLILI